MEILDVLEKKRNYTGIKEERKIIINYVKDKIDLKIR